MTTGIIIGILVMLTVVLTIMQSLAISIIRKQDKELENLKSRLVPWENTDVLQIECKPGMKLLLEMTDNGMRVGNCPIELYDKIMGQSSENAQLNP